MRLLNATTLKLEEFWDPDNTPQYAILSHTWGAEEVSLNAIRDFEVASQLEGFKKIKACGHQALLDSYQWIWVDTCCIDKTSSAELSEAINSMYAWYQRSEVCYALLEDVSKGSDEHHGSGGVDIGGCRWFTRGWTLQELLAPTKMMFYDREWRPIGSREKLAMEISKATRIDQDLLESPNMNTKIRYQSIARRMSWASRRRTTRAEDIIYCLMGIFDVNMPLLYGEGKEKAFMRLQEEILKRSTDHTLFTWTKKEGNGSCGFLARDPSEFDLCGDHLSTKIIFGGFPPKPYSMTNMGLHITLPVLDFTDRPKLVVLACSVEREMDDIWGPNRLLWLALEVEFDRTSGSSNTVLRQNSSRTPIVVRLVTHGSYTRRPISKRLVSCNGGEPASVDVTETTMYVTQF